MPLPVSSDWSPVLIRHLHDKYERIPNHTVRLTDWDSPQGQEFWRFVDLCLANGVPLQVIGETLGITNIQMRHTLYGG